MRIDWSEFRIAATGVLIGVMVAAVLMALATVCMLTLGGPLGFCVALGIMIVCMPFASSVRRK